jgi:acetyltransferase-like isoleucine patch superfamily enzyme
LGRLADWLALLGARLRAERAWHQFERCAVLGPGCRLGPAAWCVNPGPRQAVTLGSRVVCRGLLSRETFGAGQIIIHDYVYIGDDVLISCAARVEIGRFALLAHGVQVFDNDSHPAGAAAREAHYRAILAGAQAAPPAIGSAPVIIGERAWIGLNAFVGKGVTIGAGSVVAAGSVVTHDVPPHSLAAGNPARAIKQLDVLPEPPA